jgi:phosphate transport system substrate-binding protein
MRCGRPFLLRSLLGSMLVAVLAVSANGQSPAGLKISGSSTIQPLAEKIAPLYEEAGGRKVLIEGGGSGAGIKNALSGVSDIGMVSRSLTKDESGQLLNATIGFDALVFIVHATNPLAEIDRESVRSIFSGKMKSWRELNGRDDPILSINKEIGRSTLELFEGYSGLLHPGRNKDGPAGKIDLSHQIGSNLEMATIVGGLPGAIGYVSFGTARDLQQRGMPIKVLKLDGQEASNSTILSGAYPILRELNLVHLSQRSEIAQFVAQFSSPQGKLIVESLGFIPAR